MDGFDAALALPGVSSQLSPSHRCPAQSRAACPGNIRRRHGGRQPALHDRSCGRHRRRSGVSCCARDLTPLLDGQARVLLAREIQHDSSRPMSARWRRGDRRCVFSCAPCPRLRGALLGHRIPTFWSRRITISLPPLSRLSAAAASCYAQLEAVPRARQRALEALLCELRPLRSRVSHAGIRASTVRAEVEAAILAPSAAACADIGRRILAALAPELARLCRITDADALTRIALQLVDYAFSEADRAEAFGDGDSRLRFAQRGAGRGTQRPLCRRGGRRPADKGDSALAAAG